MSKIENGRSMVEMLGVLAIIGILSVAGIYGYTFAMRKYKANEIVQTASMLAVMASSMNGGNEGCVDLPAISLPNRIGGVEVEIVAQKLQGSPIHVSIKLDNNDDICEFIVGTATGNVGYTVSCGETLDITCS